MSDAPAPKPPAPEKKVNSADKGDFIALGIGCVVVLIFLFAVVLVGIYRE